MKTTILTLVGLFILVLLISYIAKSVLSKLIDEKDNLDMMEDDYASHSFTPPIYNDSEDKIVLEKRNDSSTRNPNFYRDYNEVQNLTKYNHNTYRAKNGRFKSAKKESV